MGKYEPLASHLKTLSIDEWDASFAEIEEVLDASLPESAHDHQSWWGNSYRGNHSQAKGWIDAGWEVRRVDLKQKKVRLERRSGRVERSGELIALWQKAGEISEISDRAKLERAVLESFIRREAGRRLAELGGTMPDVEIPPRRRNVW